MESKILMTLLGISLVAVAAAPASEPNHPFSQIYPVDVDLNMSEKDIFNVTEVDLAGGLIFSGDWIKTPGGASLLGWNSSSTELELNNGNLDTNGNSIVSSGSELCLGDEC